jgi:hypothetical protein
MIRLTLMVSKYVYPTRENIALKGLRKSLLKVSWTVRWCSDLRVSAVPLLFLTRQGVVPFLLN